MQPREKGAALATDIEMGSTAEIQAGAHRVKYTVPRPQQSPCLTISCDCAGAGCDKKWMSHNVHLHGILQWMATLDV